MRKTRQLANAALGGEAGPGSPVTRPAPAPPTTFDQPLPIPSRMTRSLRPTTQTTSTVSPSLMSKRLGSLIDSESCFLWCPSASVHPCHCVWHSAMPGASALSGSGLLDGHTVVLLHTASSSTHTSLSDTQTSSSDTHISSPCRDLPRPSPTVSPFQPTRPISPSRIRNSQRKPEVPKTRGSPLPAIPSLHLALRRLGRQTRAKRRSPWNTSPLTTCKEAPSPRTSTAGRIRTAEKSYAEPAVKVCICRGLPPSIQTWTYLASRSREASGVTSCRVEQSRQVSLHQGRSEASLIS